MQQSIGITLGNPQMSSIGWTNTIHITSKKGFTKAANDWKIVLSTKWDNKVDAQYLERFLKRMKSKKFIH